MDDVQDFLAQPNIAVLATVDRKGRPHAAPVWYLYEDGVFTISTARGSQKHKNLEGNPNATLVIERRDIPYYAVMARGAVELGPGFTPEQRLRLATHYLGEELGRRYVERTPGEDSISIRLRPEKVIEYNGRAGR
jgi:PPOX class probable F420-dependent enzyme